MWGEARRQGRYTINTNPRRTNGSRRDNVRNQVLREETNCWLCNEPVDKRLTVTYGKHGPKCTDPGCAGCSPHPMRAEVDEVVPVSKGGSPYDRNNCRLSHRRCNLRRGNRAPTAAISTTEPNPYPLSNTWDGLFDTLQA